MGLGQHTMSIRQLLPTLVVLVLLHAGLFGVAKGEDGLLKSQEETTSRLSEVPFHKERKPRSTNLLPHSTAIPDNRKRPGRGRKSRHRDEVSNRSWGMIERIRTDHTAPSEIRNRADRLEELLTRIDELESQLRAERQNFLRTHQEERNDLRRLRDRMEQIRHQLRSAREDAKIRNAGRLEELNRTINNARIQAQELRKYYQEAKERW